MLAHTSWGNDNSRERRRAPRPSAELLMYSLLPKKTQQATHQQEQNDLYPYLINVDVSEDGRVVKGEGGLRWGGGGGVKSTDGRKEGKGVE